MPNQALTGELTPKNHDCSQPSRPWPLRRYFVIAVILIDVSPSIVESSTLRTFGDCSFQLLSRDSTHQHRIALPTTEVWRVVTPKAIDHTFPQVLDNNPSVWGRLWNRAEAMLFLLVCHWRIKLPDFRHCPMRVVVQLGLRVRPVKPEIPFGKLRAGSRPAGENAGLRDDAVGAG
jgi:hypothetical protein